MHMSIMDAPDIRYSALNGGNGDDDHGEDGEHVQEHAYYDFEAFRKAVKLGQHPNGTPFNSDMPRWQMSDDDLADLFVYIVTLN